VSKASGEGANQAVPNSGCDNALILAAVELWTDGSEGRRVRLGVSEKTLMVYCTRGRRNTSTEYRTWRSED
jgi:hypothetical protein